MIVYIVIFSFFGFGSALGLAIVTPAWGITILPLGDSITQANNTHLSYRYNLWTKLIDDGRLFDLVGSLDNNFNAEMDGIAANKSTVDSPVWVVDQHSGFDAAADTYDNVHPDASGEEKMAQKWHDAMQTYLKPCMDGLDNDDDGFIDYPSDPDCTSPHSDEEKAVLTLPTGKCTNASP